MGEAIGTVGGDVLIYPAGKIWEDNLARGTAHPLTVTKDQLDHIRKGHAAYDFGDRRLWFLPENKWRENEPPPSEPDEEEIRREALDEFMREHDLTKAKFKAMLTARGII